MKCIFVLFALIIAPVSAASHEANTFTALKNSIAQNKEITVVLSNDNFTDPDSIHSLCDFITHVHALSSKRTKPIHIIAVTDDEYHLEDAYDLLNTEGHPFFKPDLRAHYESYLSQITESKHGFRAMDTAVVLFSLMNHLKSNIIDLRVVEGNRTARDISEPNIPFINPYFGNFGLNYTEDDQAHIAKIHPETGSKAILALLNEASDHDLFLINGGSVKLTLDLQILSPELAANIHSITVAGRIRTGIEPYVEGPKSQFGSWNQRVHPRASDEFFSKPILFKTQTNVESATIGTSPVCDGKEGHLPLYKDFLTSSSYDLFLSKEALETLNTVERLHTIFAFGWPPKMMDSVAHFYALGELAIPMYHGKWIYKDNLFSPDDFSPCVLSFPWERETNRHPYAHRDLETKGIRAEIKKLILKTGEILKTR